MADPHISFAAGTPAEFTDTYLRQRAATTHI